MGSRVEYRRGGEAIVKEEFVERVLVEVLRRAILELFEGVRRGDRYSSGM